MTLGNIDKLLLLLANNFSQFGNLTGSPLEPGFEVKTEGVKKEEKPDEEDGMNDDDDEEDDEVEFVPIIKEEMVEDEPDEAADSFIQVTISDPQKMGEGMSSYMAYRLTTKTNLKHFRRNNFTVIRRFSDFLGMHEKLTEKHAPQGRIIPPAPEKNLVGSTKVKLGQSVGVPINTVSPNSDVQDNDIDSSLPTGREFINQRRLALERFTNRVLSHPVLRRDSDVVEFLESGRDLPRATSTSGT